ncbi:sugar ABC transporter substrate-binding protein [Lactococcus allomyrinae]|uniref:Extracellular solute-binding protein n=1 Tax=Lactococcus allomyrinae TaxID=2419773 RepID=A0A387BEG0_9LACT|nr:sugar ABC transporter substrate-binding protein [Lactococcus allomyrinae]AYG00644.1 extracellular solute-binding protein [Lactococcus allomyrinae]
MKLNKKIALGTFSALAILSLTACGTSSSANKSSNKEITVWAMGAEGENLPKVAADFTKETGIKVKVQNIPWANAHDKLLTAVASKQGPDVIQMGTTWMTEFKDAGALTDLSKYISKDKNLSDSNFYDANLATTKFDGKSYGIPWANDVRVLYYRTDIFKKAGINEAPKTWDDLTKDAKILSTRGKGEYGISIDPAEQSFAFMMANQAGSSLIKDGKAQFDQPEFVQGVSYINNFIQKGYAPKQPLSTDITQTFGGTDSKTPMFISGPWMVSALNAAGNDIPGNYATAVLPEGPDNNDSVVGGNNLTIASWSKAKDESAKFISFMSTPKEQLAWYKLVNDLPTNKTALQDKSIAGNALMKPFVDQLDHAKPMPMVPQYEQIAQSYLTFQQNIWLKNANVTEQMKQFQTKAQSLLDAKN